MADLDLQTGRTVAAPAAPWAPPLAGAAPAAPEPSPVPPQRAADAATAPVLRPIALVDPNAATLVLARALRARRVPVVSLSSRRLEPASFVRGVWRRRLPALRVHPERWSAALLELAARLEPRPVVLPCSPQAIAFLNETRRSLEPHFDFAGLDWPLDVPTAADLALRRALARGEAALEVQLVRDTRGEITASCVLAWAPAAMPDVLVSSVEGTDVARRSAHFAAARGLVGYTRLLWASDRFGRLALHAASPLPGAGFALALVDGVDFGTAWHAALCGDALPAMRPRLEFVRRLPCLDADSIDSELPLVDVPVPLRWRDPVPACASWVRALVQP